MANTIVINTVTFNPAVSGSVQVNFFYKKTSESDSTYVPLNGGVPVTVPANGVLTSPIEITGLLASTSYTVKGVTTCGTASFTKVIVTLAPTCPDITDMGLTAA